MHNLNGYDYCVLSVLSEKNLLLLSQSDGQYIVASNAMMYERYPKDGKMSDDNIIKGVEWGHGVYLGHDITKLNLPGLLQEYGIEHEIATVDECRNEAIRQFNVYHWLAKDERLSFEVQWAAERSMTGEFGTTDRKQFETWLQQGCYDAKIREREEKRRKEKEREEKLR